MTENLKKYLTDHLWYICGSYWFKDTCDLCYSIITENDDLGVFVYSEDCPDIWKKMEDFPPDIIFDSEAKLIEFLEKLKLTNWP